MQLDQLNRRVFVALLGSAAAWPLAARAQQPDRVRRIGVLLPATASDAVYKVRMAAFLQELQRLGWTDGGSVRIEIRWAAGDADLIRKHAIELVALAPDVILATGSAIVGSLKWLELLKEIAPHLTRAAVLRDLAIPTGPGQWRAIQAAAPSLGVELTPVNLRDREEIERAVAAFAISTNGGLVVTGSPLAAVHRDLIITLAAQRKLPAIYYERNFAASGGLFSYGPDFVDQFRRAAGYVDRILKGEKPANLPVQAPTKYELAINLKAAKALGLTVPLTLLARADEVIE
jgi:putative ABC transport system substrate-binding protein